MVEDVEAVRRTLGLGKVALLGHSFGGVLAQAYGLSTAEPVALVLCRHVHSTAKMNDVFRKMLAAMSASSARGSRRPEKDGLYGRRQPYERNRYANDYMIAAGRGYFPYLYQRRPDPNYDPVGERISRGTSIERCGVER